MARGMGTAIVLAAALPSKIFADRSCLNYSWWSNTEGDDNLFVPLGVFVLDKPHGSFVKVAYQRSHALCFGWIFNYGYFLLLTTTDKTMSSIEIMPAIPNVNIPMGSPRRPTPRFFIEPKTFSTKKVCQFSNRMDSLSLSSN